MRVIVSSELASVCPVFVGACIEATVVNTVHDDALWTAIESLGESYRNTLSTETLKDISAIASTRRVYKACGKDPSPSCRRGTYPPYASGKGTLSP